MSILDSIINNVGLLRGLIRIDNKAEELKVKQDVRRQELDRRLADVTMAAVNGEEEWFLELVKKDPSCAIEVIKGCDLDND